MASAQGTCRLALFLTHIVTLARGVCIAWRRQNLFFLAFPFSHLFLLPMPTCILMDERRIGWLNAIMQLFVLSTTKGKQVGLSSSFSHTDVYVILPSQTLKRKQVNVFQLAKEKLSSSETCGIAPRPMVVRFAWEKRKRQRPLLLFLPLLFPL